ncbi:DNA recombination protein RmuC [Nonomuraea recticatena]|uniref:Uncharacterized protein n=1 Tax=Nonomuraea recticatena TaxID=46178 RepID=A0ABP6FSC1_9ACTN
MIHLFGDKHVVVDSKVPMAAFMAAIEAADEAEADKHWADHARQLRQHVNARGNNRAKDVGKTSAPARAAL